MAETTAGRAGNKWQRRIRLARIEAALTNTGTAALAGATVIIGVTCFVAEVRGWLNANTWVIVITAGAAVISCKALFDFRDRSNEGALWRSILIHEFGDDMRHDGESARLARLAIEFRVRVSAAEANTSLVHAKKVAALLPRVDDWLDLIVSLARKVASLRGEARFQAGLASRTKIRLSQIETQVRAATDPAQAERLAQTGRALAVQISAFEGFNHYVDDGSLRLEHAVGAFTATCSQLVLELSRVGELPSPQQIVAQLTAEVADTEQALVAMGRLVLPTLGEVRDQSSLPIQAD